jgi:hypothetical protein
MAASSPLTLALRCLVCAQNKLFDKGARIQLSFSVSQGSAAKEEPTRPNPRDASREMDRPSSGGGGPHSGASQQVGLPLHNCCVCVCVCV